MTEVSVPLALEDLLPVLLAATGAFLLASRTSRLPLHGIRWRSWVAAGSILLGGLIKVVWKLVFAITGTDHGWLEKGLFWFLMPGFVTLAACLVAAYRGRWLPHWVPGVFIGGGFTTSSITRSEQPLLVVTVIAATATGVTCVLLARQRADDLSALLFGAQLALAFALVPFAQPPQTLAKQWWEQGINTVGQGLFALACYRLAAAWDRTAAAPVAVPQEALA